MFCLERKLLVSTFRNSYTTLRYSEMKKLILTIMILNNNIKYEIIDSTVCVCCYLNISLYSRAKDSEILYCSPKMTRQQCQFFHGASKLMTVSITHRVSRVISLERTCHHRACPVSSVI